ncbi:DUF4265 domain-containing protein [Streptomyces sp. NPDC059525]|uniref:DUF4265 domain-containing protein n=1 Tax=Streptomyces sp. NPDC059525 TaxID=3346857 RepID=UPI0036B8D98C
MTNISSDRLKVHFRMDIDEDGWPPASVESARRSVEAFHCLGTTGEGIERIRMVALDVPPEADLPRIRKLLEQGEAMGWWHWEEGCVTAAWEAAAEG